MTYVIVDFEATCCDKSSFPRDEMEIIEIGAVAIDRTELNVVSEFESFVQPVRNPKLTKFCVSLTTITQTQVSSAPLFKAVHRKFQHWLDTLECPIFCSWGQYDKKQLVQDCNYHKVEYPFDAQHINVKKLFAKNRGLRKPCGLGQAVRTTGLQFEGQAHRGIDDARNIARLSYDIFR